MRVVEFLMSLLMKRIMLLLAVVVMYVSMYAIDKRAEKFVGKYDVAYEAKNLFENSPEEFWRVAIDNNKRFAKFEKAIKKDGGAQKEAKEKWQELPRLYPQYDESIVESKQAYCDSLLQAMGISGLRLDCNLYVIDTDAIDLYTMLTDNGFAICLTEGLLSMKGINNDIVMGFVAHEFVHGAYRHYLQKLFEDAKKSRRDNLVAAMVVVGTVGAAVAADALLPEANDNGNIYYFEGDKNITINNPEPTPMKYAFAFSPDQVLEADLVAFRFLENMGCSGAYLDGLKILSPVYNAYASSEVVPITKRINFITYMEKYPGLGLD